MVASLFIIYTQKGFCAATKKSPCPKFEQGRNTNNIIDYGIGVDNSWLDLWYSSSKELALTVVCFDLLPRPTHLGIIFFGLFLRIRNHRNNIILRNKIIFHVSNIINKLLLQMFRDHENPGYDLPILLVNET